MNTRTEHRGGGDDHRPGSGRQCRQCLGHENHQQRPQRIRRSPQLLGQKRAMNRGQDKEWHEPSERDPAPQFKCSHHKPSQQQKRPQGEQVVSTIFGIILHEKKKERGGQRRRHQADRRDARPPSLHQARATEREAGAQCGQRPHQRWLSVHREHQRQARQAPLGCELHRPVQVVADAGSACDRRQAQEQGGRHSGQHEGGLRSKCAADGARLQEFENQQEKDAGTDRGEKRQAHVLLEEDGQHGGCSGSNWQRPARAGIFRVVARDVSSNNASRIASAQSQS